MNNKYYIRNKNIELFQTVEQLNIFISNIIFIDHLQLSF